MGWPSWRYGPNGAKRVCSGPDDVPAGWEDTADKIKSEPSPPVSTEPVREASSMPTRKQIAEDLQRRGVPFHKNTPTAKLHEMLIEAVEKSDA